MSHQQESAVSKKLKPCPFCGEDEDLYLSVHEVLCGNCGGNAGSFGKTEDVNNEIWNKRWKPLPQLERVMTTNEESVIDGKTLQYSQDDVDVMLRQQRVLCEANIRKHWPWQFNDLAGITQVHNACLNATGEK